MNRDTLKLAIANEKLRQATNNGQDSISSLYSYARILDNAAEFQHRDAKAVCIEAIDRLKIAGMSYLDAGGRKDTEEFEVAAKTSRKLKTFEFALFKFKDDLDGAECRNVVGFSKPTGSWGETITRYLQLAA
jgi:hypothetical protein